MDNEDNKFDEIEAIPYECNECQTIVLEYANGDLDEHECVPTTYMVVKYEEYEVHTTTNVEEAKSMVADIIEHRDCYALYKIKGSIAGLRGDPITTVEFVETEWLA